MSDLREIEDLEEGQIAALASLVLRTTEDLLAAGAAPAGRKRLARELGMDDAAVLRCVNHADLHRVQGIGEQYADLLEEAGVDTVPELAQRNAGHLTARLAQVNAERSLVARLPTEAAVASWIDQAKQLDRVIVYRDAPGGAVETALGAVGPAEPVAGSAPVTAEPVAPSTSPVGETASASPASEAARSFAGGVEAPAEDVVAAAAAPLADLSGATAVPLEDVPAALEPEAAAAERARAAFDRGDVPPGEERPSRVGLTLDTSAELPQLRLREEREARTFWQRLLDRLGG